MSVAAQVVKKFMNDPENVVPEALAGIAAAHADLVKVDFENSLVIRKDAPVQGKVGLISGGGSGHEPLHGGFVGAGMLDAACAGAVFTSPVPDQMSAASRAVDGGAGVLHIVKNYTGDVLNFRMAAELVEDDGIQVESVVMDDDVRRAGLAVHRRTARCRRHRAGREARRSQRRGRRQPVGGRRHRQARQRESRARSASRSRRAQRPRAAPRSSTSGPTRSRSASASTASPAGAGSSTPTPTRSST